MKLNALITDKFGGHPKEPAMVRETGLEPVRDYHTPLKRARLPIPPLSQVCSESLSLFPQNVDYYSKRGCLCQAFFQSFLRFFSHLYTGASFLLQTSGFFGQVCPVSSYLYSNKGAAVQKDAQQPLWFSSFLPASSAAGSARPPLPASAACRSGLWAWDPAHCNRYLPGSSAPAAVPQWR